jgi:hypothetical protein
MKFPQWVSGGKGKRAVTGTELAANRLRYMLVTAALHIDSKATLSALAAKVGCSRQNLHLHMENGKFPVGTASKIEAAVGRDVIRKEHLIFPLDIESME